MALDKDGSIPSGTFITWIGMISLPVTVYWGVKEMRAPTNKLNKWLSGFLKLIIVLGMLWVPISYLLAGNLAFTFSEKETFQGGQSAMRWFWRLSFGMPAGTLLSLIVSGISTLFYKKQ